MTQAQPTSTPSQVGSLDELLRLVRLQRFAALQEHRGTKDTDVMPQNGNHISAEHTVKWLVREGELDVTLALRWCEERGYQLSVASQATKGEARLVAALAAILFDEDWQKPLPRVA